MSWASSRPRARGYDAAHNRERERRLGQLRATGIGRCCIGGEPIYAEHIGLPNAHPLKPVLDHCPCSPNGVIRGCPDCGGTGYRGLACWQHNSKDGAVRGRARQNGLRLHW